MAAARPPGRRLCLVTCCAVMVLGSSRPARASEETVSHRSPDGGGPPGRDAATVEREAVPHSQLVGQQSKPRVQVRAEQRLIRKARRSILDCKPDGALADASVVIKQLEDGSVEAKFNHRSVQGTFGRCVANYAKTAALAPDGVLKFSL